MAESLCICLFPLLGRLQVWVTLQNGSHDSPISPLQHACVGLLDIDIWSTTSIGCFLLPPPSFVLPHPLSFAGGGGVSPGQYKNFCYGSLCCCVGDCVVRHCHLYPLYPWQDILLTFAAMEFDSTTMFMPGTNVMFIHSTWEPVLA